MASTDRKQRLVHGRVCRGAHFAWRVAFIAQTDYGLQSRAWELNRAGAEITRPEAARPVVRSCSPTIAMVVE